jgi:hypothetical protein
MSCNEERAVTTPETIARFWSRVDKSGPCWLWTAGRNGDGYGYATFNKVNVGAHRMAYFLTRGPIPEGLHLDHLCRVRSCVNPDHLEPVTNGENIIRGVSPWAINRRKSACKRGHPFTPENTLANSKGGRTCRECERARQRKGGINPAAVNAAKTECIHGHPFTPENTWHHNGKRSCLECKRRATRESARRRRAREKQL